MQPEDCIERIEDLLRSGGICHRARCPIWDGGASIGGIAGFFERNCAHRSASLVVPSQWLKRIANPPESAVNIGAAAAYFKRRRVGN
jgi:hypothetical protein